MLIGCLNSATLGSRGGRRGAGAERLEHARRVAGGLERQRQPAAVHAAAPARPRVGHRQQHAVRSAAREDGHRGAPE